MMIRFSDCPAYYEISNCEQVSGKAADAGVNAHEQIESDLLAFVQCITGEPLQPWHQRTLINARQLGKSETNRMMRKMQMKAIETGTSIHEAILMADHYPTGFIQLPQAGSQVASAFPAVNYGVDNSEPTEFEGGFRKSFVHKSVINALGVKE